MDFKIESEETNNTKLFYENDFSFEILAAVIEDNSKSNNHDTKSNENNLNDLILIVIIPSIGVLVGISAFYGYKMYRKKLLKKREWELKAIKIRNKERIDKLRKKRRKKFQKR